MRRPLFTVGFSLFASSVIAFFFLPENLVPFAAAVFFAAAALSVPLAVKFKYSEVVQNLSAVLFSSAAGFLAVFLSSLIFISPLKELKDNRLFIRAQVTDAVSYEHGYTSVPAKGEFSFEGQDRESAFLLYYERPISLEVGDCFTCTVRVKDCNAGGDSWTFPHPVYLYGDCDELKVTGKAKRDINYYSSLCRQKIINSAESVFSKDISGLLCGISMSYTKNIPAYIQSALRSCSLSHLTSVSGLHVTLVSGIVLLLFSRIRSRGLSGLITLVFIWGFVFLSGMRLSAIRAAIMMTVMTLGKLALRPADSCNSLGLACIIICLFIPFSSADLGFICSVLATLGVVTLCSPVYNFISGFFKGRRILKRLLPVVNIASLTLSAMVFSLPVLVCVFGKLSIVSVLANILVTPFAVVCVVGCILGGALYSLPVIGFIGYPFLLCGGIVAKYFIFITRILSKIPFSSIYSKYSSVYIWLIVFYALLLYAFVRFRREGVLQKKSTLFISLIMACTLAVSCVCASVIDGETYRVIINSSEKSDTVILIHDGKAAVIGCDSSPVTNRATLTVLSDYGIESPDFFLPLSDSSGTGAYFMAKNACFKTVLVPQGEKYLQRILRPAVGRFSSPKSGHELFQNTYLTVRDDLSGAVIELNGQRIFVGSSPDIGPYDYIISGGRLTLPDKTSQKCSMTGITVSFGTTRIRSDV